MINLNISSAKQSFEFFDEKKEVENQGSARNIASLSGTKKIRFKRKLTFSKQEEIETLGKRCRDIEKEVKDGAPFQVRSCRVRVSSGKELFRNIVRRVIEQARENEPNKSSFLHKFQETVRMAMELTKGGDYHLMEFYWPELLDRRHHHGYELAKLFGQWKKETEAEGPCFNDWLIQLEKIQNARGYFPRKKEVLIRNIPRMKYLKPDERESYKLQLDNQGLVINPETQKPYQNQDLDTPEIFVVDAKGEMYVATKRRGIAKERITSVNHSSFLSGGSIASAGAFLIENGRITTILAKSGHYIEPDFEGVVPLPMKDRSKMMVIALKVLKNKGIELKGIQLTFDNKKKYDAEEFLEQHLKS